MADAPTPIAPRDDFFLPELCSGPVVIMVVLIAELTAFMLTMAKHLPDEGSPLWLDLARISLFLQWIALTSTGVLCLARRYLVRMPLRQAALVSYLLLLVITLFMSEIAFQLSMNTGAGRELLPASHGGFVLRNLVICAIVSALVLRYFYVLHQWKRNIRREAGARFEILQARIRPHFLFNSMNTIAALIRGRPELAERAIEDLSDLFRASLSDASVSVPLSEELSLAKQYAEIEALRLGERLKLEWLLEGAPTDARLPRAHAAAAHRERHLPWHRTPGSGRQRADQGQLRSRRGAHRDPQSPAAGRAHRCATAGRWPSRTCASASASPGRAGRSWSRNAARRSSACA